MNKSTGLILLQTYENALRTLVCTNPEAMLPPVVERAQTSLSNTNLLRVTKDDYFIYLTPPGEIYDKSIVSG